MIKMKQSIFFWYFSAALFIAGVVSCKKNIETVTPVIVPVINDTVAIPTDLTKVNFTVEADSGWTKLFTRNSGWFGADGIFSIPQNGVDSVGAGKISTTLLLFSDTQVGEIRNGSIVPGWSFINNSVAILQGNEPLPEKINFFWNYNAGNKPASVFVPNTPLAVAGNYFWLGDGFVNHELQNETIVFGYKIGRVNVGFGFAVTGSSIITIPAGSTPPFNNAVQTDAPLFVEGDRIDNGYAFGSAVFVNTVKAGAPLADGYVYVYGVKNIPGLLNKGLMVARVLPAEFKDFSKWRFLDNTGWNTNIYSIKNAAIITDAVSDELSLSPLPDGRYALVFQTNVWGSVGMRIAKTPYGPFGPVIPLWDCKEALVGKNYFVYNAKAHPHLSKQGELLISFNVNSFTFFADLALNPNLYRPRFIKLKFI